MDTEYIISIRKIPNELVYNISVENDESYVANGIIVHNCRSRLRPYFGTVPGARDYTKDFTPKFIDEAEHTAEVFKTKYWNVK